MSEKHLFEIQGPLPAGQLVSMEFSGLTLDEAFSRVMRGYNYAVIEYDGSDRRVLIVLGEIKRIEYKERAAPAQVPKLGEETPEEEISGVPGAAPPNPAGQVITLPGRTTRVFRTNPVLPPGIPQGTGAPPLPAPEQKSPTQPEARPPTPLPDSGAAPVAPKPLGGPEAQEEQPPSDRPTLGSF